MIMADDKSGTEWATLRWFATTSGERVALLELAGRFAVCESYTHIAPPKLVQHRSEEDARLAYTNHLVRAQRDYVIEYDAAEGE